MRKAQSVGGYTTYTTNHNSHSYTHRTLDRMAWGTILCQVHLVGYLVLQGSPAFDMSPFSFTRTAACMDRAQRVITHTYSHIEQDSELRGVPRFAEFTSWGT